MILRRVTKHVKACPVTESRPALKIHTGFTLKIEQLFEDHD
ncbi:MAG: hypothetical protein ACSHWU_11145 [Marinicella sp.]